jgi:hypothetical protein
MNDPSAVRLEERSRALFQDSVETLDMRTRSRLTQARHAALEAAGHRNRFANVRWWAPAVGFSAAAALGVTLWFGPQFAHHGSVDRELPAALNQSSLEDLDIVASADEMELLQDDVEFYDWANKAADPEPGSVG